MKYQFVFLFFVFFSNLVFAQTYQYLLKGDMKVDPSRKEQVSYTVRWSEENGRIDGIYSDNFFAKSARVTGESNELGRTFIVKFPEEKGGVNSMTILASLAKSSSTAVALPVSFITRDKLGNPLATLKSDSQFSTTTTQAVAQRQEDTACTQGFGALTGYCGEYAGMISEDQDRRNRCNLLFSDAVRLELSPDATIMLHFGEDHEFISTPGHSIGRIPFNTMKNSVDIMSRVCGPLSGVNSSSDSCKVLHLRGDFRIVSKMKHFNGTYTISEEGTNNVCRYSLSMDKTE
jgi:hypothetical protein